MTDRKKSDVRMDIPVRCFFYVGWTFLSVVLVIALGSDKKECPTYESRPVTRTGTGRTGLVLPLERI